MKKLTRQRVAALERATQPVATEVDLSRLTEEELRTLEIMLTDGRESEAQQMIDALLAAFEAG